jgi:signal recognition particle GTPase
VRRLLQQRGGVGGNVGAAGGRHCGFIFWIWVVRLERVEVLLVVDATTGSNALQQAREFHKAIPVTGVIVTKLDGSGKGGIIIPIQQELGIPTRFIGLGETADAFKPFDPTQFVNELL